MKTKGKKDKNDERGQESEATREEINVKNTVKGA